MIHYKKMRQLAGFFLLLCPLSMTAQTVTNDSTQTIEEVVVKGFRVPGNVLASTPIQTLSHTDMERLGIHDMGDALKRFAGVQVKDYGGVGGMKTVNIRGLGAGHTGVTYDGVQVGDCQSGQVDLSRFTLDNVSLVSLQIGQEDNIYQSAKAYTSAGLINISTLQGVSDRKSHLTTTLRTGSYGLFSPSLLYHQQFSRLGIGAYTSYERADGVYWFTLKNGIKTIHERRNNSDIQTWRGELNINYQLTDKQTLQWKAYGFTSNRGLPGAVIYDNTYSAERLKDKNVFAQMLYENQFSNHIKMKAAAKWNYAWSRYSDIPASGYKEDTYRQNETYLTATLWTNPLQGLNLSFAQDYAHNHLSMTLPKAANPTRNSLWTALAANYQIGAFSVNASLLATNIYERVKQGNASDGFHRLSPAFSMQWRCLQDFRLRFGYKDIFRTPTLNELYYTGIGNRHLNPEKSRMWNLGATYSHTFNRTLQLSLTADGYFGNVTDKIIAVPKMFYWQMMNAGKVRQLGLDVSANIEKRWGNDWTVSATGSYSLMKATDISDPTVVYYRNQIAYTPLHSGSASVLLHTPWLDFSYNVLFMGERYTLSYNIPDNRMKPFADHSITLSREFNINKQQLRVQFDVRNLGNKNYEVVRFYPMPGTNWRLSVSWVL
ncbi:TonB-dependent receptor plug domain-containing protein [Prevotella jejuni]|uniref:TonB-dependent receptor plug domain-containing protein n=1 Tax=Prevotella jejuni TaxID=1177574 RepID=UPI001BAC6F4D|nr:TonB-dependent receptor [Prevotella jejuni]QUB78300.1 TonB-dependent receptor [Prevotella jejuni]